MLYSAEELKRIKEAGLIGHKAGSILRQAIKKVLGKRDAPEIKNQSETEPADRFDAEEFLQNHKDIWNHPRITDRNNKESYEVADLMAEFANHYYQKHGEHK